MTHVNAKELKLGDVIQAFEPDGTPRGPFTTCTVVQIKGDEVTLFRPYTHTADFSYTGGVIPYIGFEQYKIFKSDPTTYYLWERKALK